MARVLVIHWRPEEAEDGLALLRKAGHEVEVFSDQGGKGLSRFRKEPPEVVLASLERLPSHSRHFAQWFRTSKGTEQVPIVFVGGKEDKVAAAREMLPDAVFCAWRTVRGAVTKALRTPQTAVPPEQLSDKPLWKRLEVRAGDRVLQVGGPADLHALLGDELPAYAKASGWSHLKVSRVDDTWAGHLYRRRRK